MGLIVALLFTFFSFFLIAVQWAYLRSVNARHCYQTFYKNINAFYCLCYHNGQ